MSEIPRHLQIETYYLQETQHVKEHVSGMLLTLADPDLHAEQMACGEDWEKLVYGVDGQFEILAGSLELIRNKIGEENYAALVGMAKETKGFLLAGDYKAAAFKLQEMGQMAWTKKPMVKV